VVVRRRAGGLDDEGVLAADVLADLDLDLAVREAADLSLPQGALQVLTDPAGEREVGVSSENLEVARRGHESGCCSPRPAESVVEVRRAAER
jgi:hypothetical protein